MPMHILQLGPYPPPVGGISRNILAIRDELRAGGHRCSIAATSKSSRIDSEPDVYHPGSALDLIRLLVRMKFDILHLHVGGKIGPRVLLLGLAATIFGRGRCVLTLHSGGYPQTIEGVAARRNTVRGFVFRRFSRIIAVNEAIAEVFSRYGAADENIHTILPYSLKQPDEQVEVPPELKEFLSDHSPTMLAVGGLESDYDPLFQIAAMKVVLAEFPNAGLMIVGDGSMRCEGEKAVVESGYTKSILLAGNVGHDVTLHLINDADVLLRTTLFDGDAISIREALYLGTPVIATDNGMRPDGVRLIEIGDTIALIRELKDAIATGKQNARNIQSDKSNISKVIDLYKQMVD